MAAMSDYGLVGTSATFNLTAHADTTDVSIAAKVVPVIYLIVGSIGNIVTTIALYRCKTMGAGSRIYFTNVCLLDLAVLWLSAFRWWLLALAGLDLYDLHATTCKVMSWLELSALLAPSLVLVAMVMQAQDGLRSEHAPGENVTRCKSLVYSGTALLVAGVFNLPRLFLFSLRDATAGPLARAGSSANATGDPRPGARQEGGAGGCGPTPGWEPFSRDAWPWLSLVATLPLPLLAVCVGLALFARRLCQRWDGASRHVNSPSHFVAFKAGVLVLSVLTLATSLPLCLLALTDPATFWADYGAAFVREGGAREKLREEDCCRGQLSALVATRALFLGQFAVRWLVTCTCCRLWTIVASLCQRNGTPET